MEINREYYQAVLPPEAQHLADVPIDPKAALYKAKMNFRKNIVDSDGAEGQVWREKWKQINTPQGEQEFLTDHQKAIAMRNSFLARNRAAQRR
jgi:hypothetical protein